MLAKLTAADRWYPRNCAVPLGLSKLSSPLNNLLSDRKSFQKKEGKKVGKKMTDMLWRSKHVVYEFWDLRIKLGRVKV